MSNQMLKNRLSTRKSSEEFEDCNIDPTVSQRILKYDDSYRNLRQNQDLYFEDAKLESSSIG